MGYDWEELDQEIPVDKLKDFPPLSWTVRKCENYKREYKDCKSIKERFHQYFIYGERADCSQWKNNYDACLKFRKNKDMDSLAEVVNSELDRKEQRLAGHLANDVWEKRDTVPPPNWNCDLMDITKENKELFPSYISAMLELSKDEKKVSTEDKKSYCVIS